MVALKQVASLCLCQHHDDETAGPNIFCMATKMRRLLDRTRQSNERSLELSEKAIFKSVSDVLLCTKK